MDEKEFARSVATDAAIVRKSLNNLMGIPRRSVDAMTGHKRSSDQSQQPGILLCSVRNRLLQPVVITAGGNLEHATHGFDGVLMPMGLDELVSRANATALKPESRLRPERRRKSLHRAPARHC